MERPGVPGFSEWGPGRDAGYEGLALYLRGLQQGVVFTTGFTTPFFF